MNSDNQRLPAADTGNASNPSPNSGNLEPVNNDQLLGEKAEKYLRESANIEDEPVRRIKKKQMKRLGKKNNNSSQPFTGV